MTKSKKATKSKSKQCSSWTGLACDVCRIESKVVHKRRRAKGKRQLPDADETQR